MAIKPIKHCSLQHKLSLKSESCGHKLDTLETSMDKYVSALMFVAQSKGGAKEPKEEPHIMLSRSATSVRHRVSLLRSTGKGSDKNRAFSQSSVLSNRTSRRHLAGKKTKQIASQVFRGNALFQG